MQQSWESVKREVIYKLKPAGLQARTLSISAKEQFFFARLRPQTFLEVENEEPVDAEGQVRAAATESLSQTATSKAKPWSSLMLIQQKYTNTYWKLYSVLYIWSWFFLPTSLKPSLPFPERCCILWHSLLGLKQRGRMSQ